MTPLPCPTCRTNRLVATRETRDDRWATFCIDTTCWIHTSAPCGVGETKDASIRAWNALVAPKPDPVRAALKVPGVADALAWAARTYTLTDDYGAVRADATGAMNDALRALADAARGSK